MPNLYAKKNERRDAGREAEMKELHAKIGGRPRETAICQKPSANEPQVLYQVTAIEGPAIHSGPEESPIV
jgi:hypothetical protein